MQHVSSSLLYSTLISLPHYLALFFFLFWITITMIGLWVNVTPPPKGSQTRYMPLSAYLTSQALRSPLKREARVSDSEVSPKKLMKVSLIPPHIEGDNTMDVGISVSSVKSGRNKVIPFAWISWPTLINIYWGSVSYLATSSLELNTTLDLTPYPLPCMQTNPDLTTMDDYLERTGG
jgi:hypothetical protein